MSGDTRVCYILGAGFSKPLGLPLACELTEQVVRYRWRDVTKGTGPDTPLLLHAGPGVQGSFGVEQAQRELNLVGRLMPEHRCSFDDPSTWPDFETLLTMLDDAAKFERDVVNEHVKGPQLEMDHLRRRMMSDLRAMLGEKISAITSERRELLIRFVQKLRPGLDSIVSFNWDTLIEIGAAAIGMEVSTGGTGAALSLIKPHGSLDLVEITEDRWEELRSSVNVIELDVANRHEINGRRHLLLRCQNPASVGDRIDGVFGDALLVAPNRRKEYVSPWIREQWRIALRLIRGADEIRIIGFSFPEADIRPQLLINWGLRANPRTRQVTVIDPTTDDQLARRIEAAAGHPVQLVRSSWQKWIELLGECSANL
jgi:hypothetical protein